MGKASVTQRRKENKNTIRKWGSNSGSGAPGDIERSTQAVMSRVTGVTLTKFLGYGGEGVACLVDVANRQGGSRKAVMKISLADDEWVIGSLAQEKRWQLSLKRATHVVQIARFATLRGTPNTPEDAKIEGDKSFYFMELMKTGDLHAMIGQAGNTGTKIPSRLLWKFFACCQSS